jgi:hypothetical protein
MSMHAGVSHTGSNQDGDKKQPATAEGAEVVCEVSVR